MATPQYVKVVRNVDRCVYGVIRASETVAFKEWTIRKGGVYIQYYKKWHEVEEGRHEVYNNEMARKHRFRVWPNVEML